jgi:large subunit ribosomal protein L7/L12
MGEKVQKIIEEIKNLTVIELNELIKELEKEFGVSSAVFQAPVQAPSASVEEAAPQKVSVILVDSGANKINIIKALREIIPNLGLKEAKDIVDNVPQTIKENIDKSEAEKIKEKIEKAGGKVEIK